MKILVIGGGGQLGSKLLEQNYQDSDFYATYVTRIPRLMSTKIHKADKTDRDVIQKLIKALSPDVVVDTAAIHNVDYCETNKEEAYGVNVIGTMNVAEACEETNAKMVFLSTDYVFDGLKGDYAEDETTNPMNYYGFSKLEGEKKVEQHCGDYLIVRTSVIYSWVSFSPHESSSGKPMNFAMWLTKKLQNNLGVSIVTDQYSSPTLADSLAQIILELCRKDLIGLYHVAGRMRMSRYGFALKLAEKMRLNQSLITPIGSNQLKQLAKRPLDSSLNVGKVEDALGMKMLTIDEALETYCQQARTG